MIYLLKLTLLICFCFNNKGMLEYFLGGSLSSLSKNLSERELFVDQVAGSFNGSIIPRFGICFRYKWSCWHFILGFCLRRSSISLELRPAFDSGDVDLLSGGVGRLLLRFFSEFVLLFRSSPLSPLVKVSALFWFWIQLLHPFLVKAYPSSCFFLSLKMACFRCRIIGSLRSNGCGWFLFRRWGFKLRCRRLVYLLWFEIVLLTTVLIVAPVPVSSGGRRFVFRSRLSSRCSLVTSHLLPPYVLLLLRVWRVVVFCWS